MGVLEVDVIKSFARSADLGNSVWYMGHLLTFLATGEDTNWHFTLIEARAVRGGEPPPHIHHLEDELYFVLEGEVTFFVGEETYEAGPGSTVFLPRGVPHWFTLNSETARTLILLTPAGLEGYFRALAEPARALTLPPPPEKPYDLAEVATVAERYGVQFLAGGR
ncbi:MAG TPA: quercetin 2,3-dioxygenase [Thermoanaerobaculia bacterium]|nr:quercetin 2,3-dioxygenase [Thermoanaerobaculia bacterium]